MRSFWNAVLEQIRGAERPWVSGEERGWSSLPGLSWQSVGAEAGGGGCARARLEVLLREGLSSGSGKQGQQLRVRTGRGGEAGCGIGEQGSAVRSLPAQPPSTSQLPTSVLPGPPECTEF